MTRHLRIQISIQGRIQLKDGVGLVRLSKKGPFAVQAFRAKGAPEGKIAPIVLFWRKEKPGWKVLAVGTISQ
ncbi:MAG TPA: hypothetical protein VNX66_09180 [Candidatus Sulfotelmatobacter sp.]|nr:hypothetical protein [Candidatus Sulfotelmatobacter sp.]